MKTRQLALVTALSMALAGSTGTQAAGFGGFLNSINSISGLVSGTNSAAPIPLVPGLAPAAAQAPTQMVKPLPVNPAFKAIRSEQNMNAIFDSGRITGQQALTELKAIRGAMLGGDMQAAMAQLYGMEADTQPSAEQSAQVLSLFSRMSMSGMSDVVMDQLITNMSVKALEGFFTTLTENPKYFADEYVELPKNMNQMTVAQKQRVLILATSLIAIKGSNKIIEASEKEFDRAMEGYKALIDKREQAVQVLATVIEAWRMASAEKQELEARAELKAYLSQEDLDFLAQFPKDIKLKDFAKDFTVQNIALEYLRKKGDSGFKDYKVAADEYVSTIGGHLRKTIGLGSMLGFSSLFLKEGRNAFKKEGVTSIQVVLPFAEQYATELGKTLSDGLPGYIKGLGELVGMGEKEFRIDRKDGSVEKKKASASDVIKFIERDETLQQQFSANLYAGDNKGYLYRVNLCANSAGALLDKAVPKDTKQEFVKGFYRLEDSPNFNFKDAFEGGFQPRRRNEVVSSLLTTDYRSTSRNEVEQAIGKVQTDTVKGLSEWDSRDLAQIIFASSLDRPHTLAQLALGGFVVRMVPSQWMVYEYENYQQNCLADVSERLKRDESKVASNTSKTPGKSSKKK